eukprot:CAMPEP_0170578494 /NCGR_PEP_ID=MMETSP0224-20130122/5483_1 /TAXON_ID=285029 /ORGANISM="Togula jolla, Strain CCCM 725" /LENGTH=625 /DNA_ID=CAMNT_0010901461 /DNA_START=392 /DNA_END=2269 /DNA_ORIENTATION=+
MDLVASFFTGLMARDGRYRKGFIQVACRYGTTWFPLDAVILTMDWFFFGLDSSSPIQQFRILRVVRLGRIFRGLRVVMVARSLLWQQVLASTRSETVVLAAMALPLVCLMLSVHVLACLWQRIGEHSEGWLNRGFRPESAMDTYVTSLHWVLAQLQGVSIFPAKGCWENLFAALLIVSGLAFDAILTSIVVYAVLGLGDPGHAALQRTCRNFLKGKRVAETFACRVRRHMVAQGEDGIFGRAAREEKLLEGLPETLQMELYELVRAPVLCWSRFFALLVNASPQALRQLCQQAVGLSFTLSHENCFCQGDACSVMRFVESGELKYLEVKPTNMIDLRGLLEDSEDLAIAEQIRVAGGDFLSEAVLWLPSWEHCGTLVADTDSKMLVVHAARFGDVLQHHCTAHHCAIEYAKKFVSRLNHVDHVSDIIFPFEDPQEDAQGKAHHIFISHYKREAGTEAALLLSAMREMILHDACHPGGEMSEPIFVDTENLVCLRDLRACVQRSDNLVVLLTPGLFQRPWCLVEIATAHRSQVNIVPVAVQRPGLSFKYPDETFYKRLLAGRILNDEDLKVINAEGVTLLEVASAIREVCVQISLPFSPHKSANIRHAEVEDIMMRCCTLTEPPTS